MNDFEKPSGRHGAIPVSSSVCAASPSKKFLGTLKRKECWGLTWRGRMIVTVVVLAIAYLLLTGIHPFLALTDRVNTDILVVEGWMHQRAARVAVDEFRSGSYQRVFTTGGPVSGSGGYINDFQTSASVGAGLLRSAGLPGEFVQMVPSRVMGRDRTFSSAVALKDWFRKHDLVVRGINVVTEDAHARRTRLLFQKAFGNGVKVGIIAIPNPDYDTKHWWRYSEGVREVLGETIAYLYARFFFHPSDTGLKDQLSTNRTKP